MPGRIRSAAYRACPDTFSGPSSWGTGWPMAAKDVLIIVPPLRLQRQLYERVGPVLAIEVATGRDDGFELRRRDRQARDGIANTARLLVEVPHELVSGGLLRVALAVFGIDRDARTEERHLVRRDDRHPLHQVQHLGRVASASRVASLAAQHREAALDDTVRGVVRRAPRPRCRVFSPAREG